MRRCHAYVYKSTTLICYPYIKKDVKAICMLGLFNSDAKSSFESVLQTQTHCSIRFTSTGPQGVLKVEKTAHKNRNPSSGTPGRRKGTHLQPVYINNFKTLCLLVLSRKRRAFSFLLIVF